MLLDLEQAKIYFLAPGSSESKYYIGGLDEMNYLAYLMSPGDLIATAGVNGEECVLLVTWDDEKCERMIEEMRSLIKYKAEDILGDKNNEPKDGKDD